MEASDDLIRSVRVMRFIENHLIELMLLTCSACLSLRLFAFAPEAKRCVMGHSEVIGLIDHRILWGTFAAIACVLKIIGLICFQYREWFSTSMMCRFVGLFMSSVMWTIIGLAYLLDCPFEIAGLQMVLMGVSAGALQWTLDLRARC